MTREEAIEILQNDAYILYEDDNPYNREAYDMAIEALEPKQGEWIKEPCAYKCSECRFRRDKRIYGIFNYCPNCGSAMKGDKE